MELIDKYFRKKVDKVKFIELKDSIKIEAKNIKIRKDLPLPIILDDFIKGIKEGEVGEDINLSYIIDGIIYIIGVDREFPYIDEYKDILINYDKNIEDYILYRSNKDLAEENYEDSAVKLRALLYLDKDNIKGLFNYGVAIEGIAKEYISKGKEEKGREFLDYSTRTLERILDQDKDFGPVYYKLGYHYKHLGQFLKASLMWKKFLPLSEDEMLTEEIREEIDLIEDDYNLEAGLTYLNYKDYDKALEYLLKLIPNHKESWNVNYFIGQAYNGLEEWNMAAKFFRKALDYNKEVDIYNELGIAYFNMGDIEVAIDIFTKGIERNKEDFKLYFNRGLAYVELASYRKSLEDMDKAYELNPDDNIRSQRNMIESLMHNN